MYCKEYNDTKEKFAEKLKECVDKAIKKKQFKNRADFVRTLSKKLCTEEKSTSSRFYEWIRGENIPAVETCIKICQLLEVDLDYLLGHTEPENRDIDFIHKETGLTKENIKRLRAYNNEPGKYNFSRVNAINMILSSEKGLQIVEAMAKYIEIEPDAILLDTPQGGTYSSQTASFIVAGASYLGRMSISKDELPAVYLTAITKLLTEWKTERQKDEKEVKNKYYKPNYHLIDLRDILDKDSTENG